jgi:hypothetical protein
LALLKESDQRIDILIANAAAKEEPANAQFQLLRFGYSFLAMIWLSVSIFGKLLRGWVC